MAARAERRGERAAGFARFAVWTAACLAVVLALVLAAAGVVVLHDALVVHNERTPFWAYCKAHDFLNDPRSGVRVGIKFLEEQGLETDHVETLEDGRFRVLFQVRVGTVGVTDPASIPVRCTVRCNGVDDWTLERLEVGELPPHDCAIRSHPTGRARHLWTGRIYNWLRA